MCRIVRQRVPLVYVIGSMLSPLSSQGKGKRLIFLFSLLATPVITN